MITVTTALPASVTPPSLAAAAMTCVRRLPHRTTATTALALPPMSRACPRSRLWTHALSPTRACPLPPTQLASWLSPQHNGSQARPLSASSNSQAGPPDQDQREQQRERDRQLNMGRAVHVLRHELDHFCSAGLVTTDIYAPDVRFYDPHSRLHLTSLRQYLLASKVLRWLLHLYYMDPQVALTRMVQLRHPEPSDVQLGDPSAGPDAGDNPGQPGSQLPRDVRDDEDGALRVTFLLTGLPRHRYWWRVLSAPGQPLSEADVDQMEGVAMYTFNRAGRIHAHWIERLIPRPTLLRYLAGASGWWRRPGGPTSVDEWRAGWCCQEVKVPLGRPVRTKE